MLSTCSLYLEILVLTLRATQLRCFYVMWIVLSRVGMGYASHAFGNLPLLMMQSPSYAWRRCHVAIKIEICKGDDNIWLILL